MSSADPSAAPAGRGGLTIRDAPILAPEELAALRALLGADLDVSSTLRRWQDGESVTPHSVSVALEAVLRMLGPDEGDAAPILELAIDRIAEAFPEETLPL